MGKEIGARSGWDEPEGKKRTSQSRGVFSPVDEDASVGMKDVGWMDG
jgi:hypothetical protein